MRYFPAILMLCAAAPAFAANPPPLASLTDAEKTYYRQIFDYTMDNIQPDGHYDWASYSGKGSIGAGERFVSKSGYTCRNFSESYAVNGQAGSDKGVSCKRVGEDGWCRLKAGNALTCAMEQPYYGINIPIVSAPDVPSIPNVDVPDGGGINTSVNTSGGGYHGSKPTASDAANSITGTAGNAAGYVARNAGGWFSSIFR